MWELGAVNNAMSCKNPTPKEKRDQAVAMTVATVVYLIFLIWALTRAMKCSSANPDSRAIHFLFAFASPVVYIIVSYTVPGFEPSTKSSQSFY